MPASNTLSCFEEFFGQKFIGILVGELPLNDKSVSSKTKTLVFEDGRGLTISSNGSYWVNNAKDVSLAIQRVRERLERNSGSLRTILELAGKL